MDNEQITLLAAILELGWPAVVLMQSIVLYRAHSAMTDRYLSHLERESERTAIVAAAAAVRDDAERAQPNDFTI